MCKRMLIYLIALALLLAGCAGNLEFAGDSSSDDGGGDGGASALLLPLEIGERDGTTGGFEWTEPSVDTNGDPIEVTEYEITVTDGDEETVIEEEMDACGGDNVCFYLASGLARFNEYHINIVYHTMNEYSAADSLVFNTNFKAAQYAGSLPNMALGTHFAMGDVDGDGFMDIVASGVGSADNPDGTVVLINGGQSMIQDGDTLAIQASFIGTDWSHGHDIEVVDYDANGFADVMITQYTDAADKAQIFGYLGGDFFGTYSVAALDYDAVIGDDLGGDTWLGYSSAFGDMDGDGLLDIAIGSPEYDGIPASPHLRKGRNYIILGSAPTLVVIHPANTAYTGVLSGDRAGEFTWVMGNVDGAVDDRVAILQSLRTDTAVTPSMVMLGFIGAGKGFVEFPHDATKHDGAAGPLDINGDEFGDFYIALGNKLGSNYGGKVVVFAGEPGITGLIEPASLATIEYDIESNTKPGFGMGVAIYPDLIDAGEDVMLIGSLNEISFYQGPNFASGYDAEHSITDHGGYHITIVGDDEENDLNGDGYPDIVFGEPAANGGRGAVTVLY